MKRNTQSRLRSCMIATLSVLVLMAPVSGLASQPDDTSRKRAETLETIGANLLWMRDIVRHHGVDTPILPSTEPGRFTEEGASGLLRFSSPIEDDQIRRLQEAGVRFNRNEDGTLVQVGTIYSGFIPWEAFDALRATDSLVRVNATWHPAGAVPLETTGKQVGAHQIRRQPNFGIDGEGVTLGDMDTAFYIYHPHFFRADGGWYDWVDVDGDGELTLGTDGVDLDASGSIEDDEVLRLLEGTAFSRRDRSTSNDNGELDPALDWVYVDTNGDSQRTYGPDAGYTESTPAYGEPMFVVDDVDGDGTAETPEKLVRLGTSKFKRVLEDDQVYRRGENLIELGTPGRDRRAGHGTSVTSVMAGGQPRFHDRVGLAPAAELVGYSRTLPNSRRGIDTQGSLRYLQDAQSSSVDVVVHEYSGIAREYLDGSSSLEQAITEARNAGGVAQVTPVGNLNESKSHIERTVSPDSTTTLKFFVGDGVSRGGETYPFFIQYGSLLWRDNASLDVTLVSPSGESKPLEEGRASIAGSNLAARLQTSSRGTHQLFFSVYNESRESIEKGTWKVEISGASQSETVYGRVTDALSSWNVGIYWENATRDRGTVTWPATADGGFGVAAFNGTSPDRDAEIGELFGYSGRGPRLDGAPVVDIAAPANPFAAMAFNEQWRQFGLGSGSFTKFGGTSGAGPHVAAAVGLMAQQDPSGSPSDWESALTSTADTAELTPSPEPSIPARNWGHGKVDVFDAIAGSEPVSDNRGPSVDLTAEAEGRSVQLDASSGTDPDGDTLRYRFDVDYDGTWDVAWQSSPMTTVSASTYGQTFAEQDVAKVQVRDEHGLKAAALTTLSGLTMPNPEADTGTDAGMPDQPDTSVSWDDTGQLNRASSVTADGNGCGGCASGGSDNGMPASLTIVLLAGGLCLSFRRD